VSNDPISILSNRKCLVINSAYLARSQDADLVTASDAGVADVDVTCKAARCYQAGHAQRRP